MLLFLSLEPGLEGHILYDTAKTTTAAPMFMWQYQQRHCLSQKLVIEYTHVLIHTVKIDIPYLAVSTSSSYIITTITNPTYCLLDTSAKHNTREPHKEQLTST
jgi:hypothetical protein